MGEVYRARDERLHREVAIKVLGGALAGDRETLERFRREAQLLAAVTHPNVCQIFDLGDHQGAPFLAMELLSGEPLSARLAARGALPAQDAVRIARDLLAALGELHRRGIVHRDLKPSNVYLTPHGTKLLDLGVARQVSETPGEAALTRTGTALGTPRYMAPEQWNGAAEPRSDLFACGAVLFEMLTGRPAYPGDTALEILQGVLRGGPPSLGGAGPDALDRLLCRALAARPEDRFASAAEMAAALAAAGTSEGRAAGAPKTSRLRVLPLRLLRPDPEIEFLSLALADAVTASLAGFTHLVVRSSRVARAAEEDPARVAAEAGVDAVLYGTLLRSGERVRVSTQLVEAASGTVACSSTAEASMRDLFELQDDLARQVVEALRIPLSPADVRRSGPPPDPRAYELYLRATGAPLSVARSASLIKARDLLRASVDLDPALGPAWAQLGRIHRLLAKYGHAEREENVRAARQAFETALALDPDSPQAHNLYTHFEIEELATPGQAMLRLLGRVAAQRAGAALYAGLATACRYCGLFEASLAAHARARALDPQIPTGVHYTYWMMGDYQTAMALDDEPVDFVRLYALPMLGRTEEALAGYAEWRARLEDGLEVTVGESMIAALRGDREACLAAARQLLDAGFRDAEGLYFLARCVAYAGDPELALATLERVVDSGFTCPTTFERDPWLASLRAEPRFRALVDRATAGHRHAQELFLRARGPALLGLVDPPTRRM
jgi:non-specific serine/threonine protein kinase